MKILKAAPAGSPAPTASQGSAENIEYAVDISQLLNDKEMATKIIEAKGDANILDTKIRFGKFIDVRVGPIEIGTTPYTDYLISVVFETDQANIRVANISVRIYR